MARDLLLGLLEDERERLVELGGKVPRIYDRLVPGVESNAASFLVNPTQARLDAVLNIIRQLERASWEFK